MLILNLWKCLFVKATTTLLTTHWAQHSTAQLLLLAHFKCIFDIANICNKRKKQKKTYTNSFNVHCTLKISFIMSRSLSSHAPNNLIFFALLSAFIPFRVLFSYSSFLYLDLLFGIRYIYASVCVHSHAFHFMTYEIFIILEMYAFLSFCFIRKRIEREKPYKNNENMPNIDNNAILYETQVKDLFGLLQSISVILLFWNVFCSPK